MRPGFSMRGYVRRSASRSVRRKMKLKVAGSQQKSLNKFGRQTIDMSARPGTTEGQGDIEKSASVKTSLLMHTLR